MLFFFQDKKKDMFSLLNVFPADTQHRNNVVSMVFRCYVFARSLREHSYIILTPLIPTFI